MDEQEREYQFDENTASVLRVELYSFGPGISDLKSRMRNKYSSGSNGNNSILGIYMAMSTSHLITKFRLFISFFLVVIRRYETEARYLCVPSREDVYKLLVGLHENRNGNHQTTVNFCNRKRPAKAIFTNIRFLG